MNTHENENPSIENLDTDAQSSTDPQSLDPRRAAVRQLAEIGRALRHLRHAGAPAGPRAPWHDPSQGQGRLLALLKLQPEITQRELTFLLGMSRQAVAELLAKLEAKGLVEREPSTTDRRVVVVRLTDAGREAAAKQATDGRDSKRDLLDVLTDDEVAQLTDMLGRIQTRVHTELGARVAARGGRRFPADGAGERGPWGERGGFGPERGFGGPERGPRGPRGGFGPERGERGPRGSRGFRGEFPTAGGPRPERGHRRGHGC